MEQKKPMSLEQIQAFMAASEELRFESGNGKEIYNWVRQTVTEQQYYKQGKRLSTFWSPLPGARSRYSAPRESRGEAPANGFREFLSFWRVIAYNMVNRHGFLANYGLSSIDGGITPAFNWTNG